MRNTLLLILLTNLLFGTLPTLSAQKANDTLLMEREYLLNEYTQFKDSMTVRTWINLVNLGKIAHELIEKDNLLLVKQHNTDPAKIEALRVINEKLSFEIASLQKELNEQKSKIDNHNKANNILLILLGAAALVLILAIIYTIDRHRRYKFAIYELERMWSANDEQQNAQSAQLVELKEAVRKLTNENERLTRDITALSGVELNSRKKLKEEIKSRKQVEKDIQDLIDQIKKQEPDSKN